MINLRKRRWPEDEKVKELESELKKAGEALSKIANHETSEHPMANSNLFGLAREIAEKALASPHLKRLIG